MATIVLYATEVYKQAIELLLNDLHKPTIYINAIECARMAKGPTELRVANMIREIKSRGHVLIGRNYLSSREWRAVLDNNKSTPDTLVIITDKMHNFPSERASAKHDVFIFDYPDYKFIKRRTDNVEDKNTAGA